MTCLPSTSIRSIGPVATTTRRVPTASRRVETTVRRWVLGGLMIVLAATTATAKDWSDEVFPIKKHDFGTVAVAAETDFFFPVTNTFSSPLHIASIRASCGCTTPTVLNEYIQPGQSGMIQAHFNTDTFRGKKGATLTVVVDKPFYSEVRLRVDGYIRSDMVFHPGSIQFGQVAKGSLGDSEGAKKTSKVMYAGRDDWQILDVTSNKPFLVPAFVESSRGGGRVNYDLTVMIREDAPEGFFQDELTVMTNDRNMPKVPLKVSGRIESLMSVTPKSIAVGEMSKGQSQTRRLVLVSKQPIRIEGIQSDDFEFKVDPSTSSKQTHILEPTFQYTGDQTGTVRSRCTIVTADGGPTATFTIVADVTKAE